MRSLPRIVKRPGRDQDIRPYDFFAGFKIVETEPTEEEELEKEVGEEDHRENEESELLKRISVLEEETLRKAEEQAGQILQDARQQAELLREQGYAEGTDAGREAGFQEAYEEQRRLLDAELQELRKQISDVLLSVSIEKTKVLEQYIDDLKRISLAVAEKIIQTSLQSSGDIVKRMILAATDKITKKQWAKIYITKCDTGVSMEVDTEFLEALSR